MYDHIIVGSGLAGLYLALLAQEHGRVLLLTKAALNDSNTNQAQGGIAAAIGKGDSAFLHWRDTLAAGAGLSDPAAAWVLAREAEACISDLHRFGVPFDRENGVLALAREGAHSRPRVLHAGGDATGARVQDALGRRALESPNVVVREHHLVTDLTVTNSVARGVVAIDSRTGQKVCYRGRNVVLATGGAGQLYAETTNPAVATGTGMAIAYRAGARLADLEFCQFHPTALALPGAPRFLISEAARGEGGILRGADGRRFMTEYDSMAELAPRHVVSDAILTEMQRFGTSHVYLDLSHLPADHVQNRFPVIAAFCRQYGLDISRDPIPVAPAAHYMMGGVRTDLWGESSVSGLFACGEVACTGVHGANRLASNSLLEALVFGARVMRRSTAVHAIGDDGGMRAGDGPDRGGRLRAIDEVPIAEIECVGPDEPGIDRAPEDVRISDLQGLMSKCVGTARTRESLQRAEAQLATWSRSLAPPTTAEEHERQNMILVSRLAVAAALARQETRGAHRRLDFPLEDTAWRRRLVFVAPHSTSECATPCSRSGLA